MATAAKAVKDATFQWEGMDKRGKKVKGLIQAGGEAMVNSQLRKQGITVTKVKKQSALFSGGKRITEKDITLFTRQLATMMKSGVPLLQAFDIVARATPIRRCSACWSKSRPKWKPAVEPHPGVRQAPAPLRRSVLQPGGGGRTGRYPGHRARPSGHLQGKNPRHQGQDQVRLVLSDRDHRGRVHHHGGHHDLRDSGLQERVRSFGADLPGPTLVVMAISDFFVEYWWAIFAGIGGGIYGLSSGPGNDRRKMQIVDGPHFAAIADFRRRDRKSTIARWTRTLATMFAAACRWSRRSTR
jgi:type IV pilus assembly protein PilC